jgi:hypothetical protein
LILGFTLAFISRISIFKFHCHIFFIYYTILPSPQTITVRFLPTPSRRLQSDFYQTHPDDYNKIFAKPTQTTTIKFLPNPPRRLQSDFCHPHPDDYNQIFTKPNQKTTIRFLPDGVGKNLKVIVSVDVAKISL